MSNTVVIEVKNQGGTLTVTTTTPPEEGIVKWFSGPKGYGFILPDGGGAELYVHQTDIKMEGYRTLREGDRVRFSRGDSGRGPRAFNVMPLSN